MAGDGSRVYLWRLLLPVTRTGGDLDQIVVGIYAVDHEPAGRRLPAATGFTRAAVTMAAAAAQCLIEPATLVALLGVTIG
jgi:hypothetical protein